MLSSLFPFYPTSHALGMALPPDLEEALKKANEQHDTSIAGLRSLRDEPDEAPERERAVEPADETPAAPDLNDVRRDLAVEAARREALEREVQFLRAGAQAPAQTDPLVDVLNAIQLDEETWTEMVANPKEGARRVSELMRGAIAASSQATRQSLIAEIGAAIRQRDEQLDRRMRTVSNQNQFWSDNADLKPHEELVQAFALQVANEQGTTNRTHDQIINEVTSRTRNKLKEYGVSLGSERATRVRPAAGDRSTGTGSGSRSLTKTQKEILAMVGRNVA